MLVDAAYTIASDWDCDLFVELGYVLSEWDVACEFPEPEDQDLHYRQW